MKIFLLILISIFILNYSGFAQDSDKIVDAIKINENVTIDGELNEDIWQVNAPIINFREYDPEHGSEPF